ncbi:MAG TPA: type I secretion system permease/ATPase [Devosiaceae bacterium]|nr:type I secretion system permease/ATPase [Devosiaceae bacterium]
MARDKSELRAVFDRLRRSFLGVGIMSCIINLLMLTGPLFMIAVYDQVIPTKNIDTLIGLMALGFCAYLLYGLTDRLRGRVMARFAASFSEALSGRVFDAVLRQPLVVGFQADTVRPLRDLEEIKNYLSGPGMTAVFDLPWIPIYLFICFAFHPLIGLAVTLGAVVLVLLAALAEISTRALSRQVTEINSSRNAIVELSIRNAEVLMAMGILVGVRDNWRHSSERAASASLRLADKSGTLLEASKISRMLLQSGVLALGAYLVINGQASGGVIIASSILSSRALAPVDILIGTWRSLLAARDGWGRVEALLERMPSLPDALPLPPPMLELSAEDVSLTPPGSSVQTLSGISFSVPAGSAVAILGPSGAGKSSLVRTLVGIWRPLGGVVRLDGADVQLFSLEQRRRSIGYLPQDVELLEGTIAENIARFDEAASPDSIIAAAVAAHVHDLILRLPQGYDTLIGPGGALLSAGQKQRVALARALYGEPFLVVLDEPNSNLDAEGEAALSRAVLMVRQRGGIVLMVAHRESALAACDRIMVVQGGELRAYGLKEDILRPRPTSIDAKEPRGRQAATGEGATA